MDEHSSWPGGYCYDHTDCRANSGLAEACKRRAFFDALRTLTAGKRVRFTSRRTVQPPLAASAEPYVGYGVVAGHHWRDMVIGSHYVIVRPDRRLLSNRDDLELSPAAWQIEPIEEGGVEP